jgi:hypothetical protein
MLDSSFLQIGTKPQFFIDDLVIESVQDMTRRHHQPQKTGDGPMIRKDRPWEETIYITCNTWNVIYDPQDSLFKCWYENWMIKDGHDVPSQFRESDGKIIVDVHEGKPSCVCYAQSTDGVTWEKPELDIVQIDGANTNVVMGLGVGGATAHCATVMLDPMETDPSRRFKMFFMNAIADIVEGTTGSAFFALATSPDGIYWALSEERPVFGLTERSLGDVVTLTADPAGRVYWLNNRHPDMCTVPADPACPPTQSWISPYGPQNFARQNKRRVFRSQSADLIHWSHPRPLVVPDDAVDNLDDVFYGMEQFQVGEGWLGFLNVLHQVDNTMDVQLVYSRDGENFDRVRAGHAWLESGDADDWDANMVSICSKPIVVGDELYVYHGGSRRHHDWWMTGPSEGLVHPEVDHPDPCGYGIGLAKIKRDRFVSLDTGPVREGVLVTHPMRPRGTELVINGRCRDGGSIRAELTDAAGNVIAGFEKETCIPFAGDAVAHTMQWQAGEPTPEAMFLRLRLYVWNGEVFSFQFR